MLYIKKNIIDRGIFEVLKDESNHILIIDWNISKTKLNNNDCVKQTITNEEINNVISKHNKISNQINEHEISNQINEHEISNQVNEHEISNEVNEHEISNEVNEHEISNEVNEHEINNEVNEHEINNKG